jgi:tRNA 2-thiocytidine biosynthesis protein TtcA
MAAGSPGCRRSCSTTRAICWCCAPLAYCAEDDLARFAQAMEFPIIPCDLCGSQDGLQRNAMKAMLADIEARMPGRKDAMLRALAHVNPSHLLDTKLFDFAGLDAGGSD